MVLEVTKSTTKLIPLFIVVGLTGQSVFVLAAHSFQHFHGPVVGSDRLVTWGHHHDFSYGVQDHRGRDIHGQKERRDGNHVSGEYSLWEPNDNVRIVKYHAGQHGFYAHVRNSNGNDHSGCGERGYGFGRYSHWYHY